jgi:Family of unknown function (DUF6502)
MRLQDPLLTEIHTVRTSSAPLTTRIAKAQLRGKALAVEAFGAEHASQAVERLLLPMAQMMIGHGLQFAAVSELLKKALVDAAMTNFGIGERSVTDSRIAVLTGVHRKDVRRLREEPAPKSAAGMAKPLMSIGAQVVARWISDPTYLTAHNQARPLARTPRHAQPGEPDFTSLVAQISQDVGARAVLEELLRLGIVHSPDEVHVALHSNAFVPQEGINETFHFLASNVSDHLATAVHNLHPERATRAMLEQSAFSQNLSDEDANELEQTARVLWATALQQFLQKATAAEQRSSKKPDATQRVRYGVYFHKATMPPETPTKVKSTLPRKKG